MGQRKEPGMDFDLEVFNEGKPNNRDKGLLADCHTETANPLVEKGKPTGTVKTDRQAKSPRLLKILVLLILVSVVAQFVWVTDVVQSQEVIKRELGLALDNIDAIGGALNSQGETILSKGGETQKKIIFLDTEVRKLWNLANKRNKTWITQLQEQTSTIEKNNVKLAKDVQQTAQRLDKDLKRLEKFAVNQKSAQVAIAALEETVVDLRTLLQSNAETMAQLDGLVKSFSGQDIGGDMTSLITQVDDLSKRLVAVDAHRRQVNRLLEQLDTEIRALKARP